MNQSNWDLMGKVRAFVPTARERADEAERNRRMSADVAQAMARTGIIRMLRPANIGGLEVKAAVALEAIETLAQADASAGWCAMIGATSGIYSAYMEPALARQVYGEADETITAGVFAPMGQAIAKGDHYEVTGHWRWASGSWNSQWLNGGCTIIENGELRKLPNGAPEIRAMIFPREDVELVDTWQTMGLAGTGSVDMKVQGVRVPKARTVSLLTDKPRTDGPLYVFPVFGLLALGIAAVASGNARAALDEFREFAGGARTGGARRVLAERAAAQSSFAQAQAQWRSARAFLYDEVDNAWQAASSDGRISLEQRGLLRLAATHVTRTAAEVCRTVHDLSGGAAIFESNLQQRRLRDAQTATAHMMIAPPTYELAGRVLLGVPTDDTMV